jgi:TRAP-type transport system periplasmic protein
MSARQIHSRKYAEAGLSNDRSPGSSSKKRARPEHRSCIVARRPPKTEDALIPAYGALPVHMPFGDVYTALQTGVVDLAENGINVYLSNKHYEAGPVMSLSEHEANNSVVWVSDKVWNSLTPQQQGWVQAAADEVGKTQPAKALMLEHESLIKLEKVGVKIVKDVDKSGFIKAAAAVNDQQANELGPHAVKILGMVRAIQ